MPRGLRTLVVVIPLWGGCPPAPAPEAPPDAPAPAPPAAPPGADGTTYRLSFPSPHTHYVEVEATFPTGGAEALTLMMATWTPGSYLMREFSQHVEAVEAGGRAVRKVGKNRWSIDTVGIASVTVTYRVYGRVMGVRDNFVDAEMAILNGAPTYLVPVDQLDAPAVVQVEPAAGWETSVTSLAATESPHRYRARDYDELVDAPIVVGNPRIQSLEVEGPPVWLVTLGDDGGFWDHDRAAADVARLVDAQIAFWGSAPYGNYRFLNILGEGGGGLEHEASTLMITSRWNTGTRKAYTGWLGLVSHEFFHTWNVKRLRPEALGPFDYEHEVYTPDLWIAEGFTSYYDDLILARAGLITQPEYLGQLSKGIAALQKTPGRGVHPLSQASNDAWIKHYRRNENSPNTTISYYTKGAVVGWLLDAEVRRHTGDRRSLDDVLRLAYTRHAGERGYSAEAFRALASEVAGTDLSPWFHRAVDSTEELEYAPALDWFGLRFAPEDEDEDEGVDLGEFPLADPPDEPPGDPDPGWLGLELSGTTIRGVRRDTPGYEAGFNVGDEILAIDAHRVTGGGWKDRLEHYPPGASAEVLIARRGLLKRLPVTFGEAPAERWKLEEDATATPRRHDRRRRWLSGR